MKKLIIITVLAIASLSSYGQIYYTPFTSPSSSTSISTIESFSPSSLDVERRTTQQNSYTYMSSAYYADGLGQTQRVQVRIKTDGTNARIVGYKDMGNQYATWQNTPAEVSRLYNSNWTHSSYISGVGTCYLDL